jgi:alpha-N-arabinofuranosidase
MYKAHQDGLMLPVDVQCEDYTLGGNAIPGLTVSASRDDGGRIHISLANLDPVKDKEVQCALQGAGKSVRVTGEILTAGSMTAFNDFGKPEEVKPALFSAFKVDGPNVIVRMPAKSVVMLEVQ